MKGYTTGGIFTYILLFLFLFSSFVGCVLPQEESKAQEENNQFDKYKELQELLQSLKIPMPNSKIVLMPTAVCVRCIKGANSVLDSVPYLTILHNEMDSCYSLLTTQNCKSYTEQAVIQRGLKEFYAQYFRFGKDGEIIEYRVLLD